MRFGCNVWSDFGREDNLGGEARALIETGAGRSGAREAKGLYVGGTHRAVLSALALLNPFSDILSKVMSLVSLAVGVAAFGVAFLSSSSA